LQAIRKVLEQKREDVLAANKKDMDVSPVHETVRGDGADPRLLSSWRPRASCRIRWSLDWTSLVRASSRRCCRASVTSSRCLRRREL
jgi:hypothetical protein